MARGRSLASRSAEPLGPRKLDFGQLTAEDFELLCFLILTTKHKEARRPRAQDAGADALLPDSSGIGYSRCWQFKRFTQNISWPSCIDSLDRAVERYKMPHYTFCFARDLTGNQERFFLEKLAGRHKGVKVDYWSHSQLLATLITSPDGERIVNWFYERPSMDISTLLVAVRAGGPLESGADVSGRLRAVAEWLIRNDPWFSYTIGTREVGMLTPAPQPGSIGALELHGPQVVERYEALPRNDLAIEEFGPAGKILFDDSEAGRRSHEAFQQALASGEGVTIEEGSELIVVAARPAFVASS